MQGTVRQLMWLKQSKQRENNRRGSQRPDMQYEEHGRTLLTIVKIWGFTLRVDYMEGSKC